MTKATDMEKILSLCSEIPGTKHEQHIAALSLAGQFLDAYSEYSDQTISILENSIKEMKAANVPSKLIESHFCLLVTYRVHREGFNELMNGGTPDAEKITEKLVYEMKGLLE